MPGGERNPLAIVETIKKHQVSVMHFVPSMLNVFLEYLEGKDASVLKAPGFGSPGICQWRSADTQSC